MVEYLPLAVHQQATSATEVPQPLSNGLPYSPGSDLSFCKGLQYEHSNSFLHSVLFKDSFVNNFTQDTIFLIINNSQTKCALASLG